MERLQRCALCTSASESMKRVTEDVANAETGGCKNTIAKQTGIPAPLVTPVVLLLNDTTIM